MRRYIVVIEPQAGNTDVSITHAMAELREFRKLHPAPAALPPKPTRKRKNKR